MERIDTPILVIIDADPTEGPASVSAASTQALTLARGLTTAWVDALVGAPDVDVDVLSRFGARRALVADLGELGARNSAMVANAALAALSEHGPYGLILNATTYHGREVAAMIAARLGSAAAADVTECWVENGRVVAAKAVLGGAWLTNFAMTTSDTPVVSVRPSAFTAEEVSEPAGVERLDLAFERSHGAQACEVVTSNAQAGTGRVPLTEASVVVCAGRGTEGDLTLVEELADRLGAAVGATRVVCDEGWADRALQIGQTGVSVAPTVYIGVGVSGAVHHTCGIQGAEHIVAIDDDPDAPIMEIADFAVVGDLNEVIPAALAALDQ